MSKISQNVVKKIFLKGERSRKDNKATFRDYHGWMAMPLIN